MENPLSGELAGHPTWQWIAGGAAVFIGGYWLVKHLGSGGGSAPVSQLVPVGTADGGGGGQPPVVTPAPPPSDVPILSQIEGIYSSFIANLKDTSLQQQLQTAWATYDQQLRTLQGQGTDLTPFLAQARAYVVTHQPVTNTTPPSYQPGTIGGFISTGVPSPQTGVFPEPQKYLRLVI